MSLYNTPRETVAAEIRSIREQRFGLFRERGATAPRIRLSRELDIYSETWQAPDDFPWRGKTIAELHLRGATGALILGIIRGIEP